MRQQLSEVNRGRRTTILCQLGMNAGGQIEVAGALEIVARMTDGKRGREVMSDVLITWFEGEQVF